MEQVLIPFHTASIPSFCLPFISVTERSYAFETYPGYSRPFFCSVTDPSWPRCRDAPPTELDYVLSHITVSLSEPASLDCLEHVADYEIFQKTLRSITFNLAYYDKALVENRTLFKEHCESQVGGEMDIYDMYTRRHRSSEPSEAVKILGGWWNMPDFPHSSDESRAANALRKSHEQYTNAFKAQQALFESGHAWKVFGDVLNGDRFRDVQSVLIADWQLGNPGEMSTEEELIKACAAPAEWRGTFASAKVITPPVHVLLDLFQALESLRMSTVSLQLTAPFNLTAMRLNNQQQEVIMSVMRDVETAGFTMHHWERREGDSIRSSEEMESLGSWTKALFSSDNLQSLSLKISGFPRSNESTLSLSTLLSPRKKWREVNLESVLFRKNELLGIARILASNEKPYLALNGAFMLDGKWIDLIDALKEMGILQNIWFWNSSGGDFTRSSRDLPFFPHDAMHQYASGNIDRDHMVSCLDGWIQGKWGMCKRTWEDPKRHPLD